MSELNLNDLPELPFEKILGYLSLEERIKARAVSRRWFNVISSFKTLCFSDRPTGFIKGKNRIVSGAFVQNFIHSTKFEQFFDTFSQSILFGLKLLRLCGIDLNAENVIAFAHVLNSFGQLEEFDLFCFKRFEYGPSVNLNLNLPMLNRIQLEDVCGIHVLTLDAPKLKNVKYKNCSFLRLNLVHGESVERLIITRLERIEVEKLKNLKYLCMQPLTFSDYTFLSSLEQLEEIDQHCVFCDPKIFEMRQYRSSALKIYHSGVLLDDLEYKLVNFARLAENHLRIASDIPLFDSVDYSEIEEASISSELAMNVRTRLTDLKRFQVSKPVQDIERFLYLLNDWNIPELHFAGRQPQDVYDRLPGHCAVQGLTICSPPADLGFLFRLKQLVSINLEFFIEAELIQKAFEDLPFLLCFEIEFRSSYIRIERDHRNSKVLIGGQEDWMEVSDLSAAI